MGTLSAYDSDEGDNAVVVYTIYGGADADSFSLTVRGSDPATLTTLTELDYESDKRIYSVHVRAQSGEHLFSIAMVTVIVDDVNDNVPQLRDFAIVFNNYRDHFDGGRVARVPAWDPDARDRLRFRFVAGNQAGLLHLDEETGMMRLDSRLNSDMPTNGSLLVSVSGERSPLFDSFV